MKENEERGVADPPREMMGSPEAMPALPQNDPDDVPDPLPEDAGTIALPDVGQGESPENLPPPM